MGFGESGRPMPRESAVAPIRAWTPRALHAAGFVLAVRAVGSAWLGYLLLPVIAALLATVLMSAARAGRLRPVMAYAASTLAFMLAGLAAVHAWSAGRTHLLALADAYLGPWGVNQDNAFLWAGLIAAIGAMFAAVVAGRRDLWGAFAWFVWCYWSIGIVGCVAGMDDVAYDAERNVFVSLPTGAVVGASVASAVVLVVALSRRAARRRLA
jgi:hypothetical protein